MYIVAYKRCLNYWLKVLKMTDDRYVKKCYIILKCCAETVVSNWAINIRKLLCMNGLAMFRRARVSITMNCFFHYL